MDLLMAYGYVSDEKNLAEKKFLECNLKGLETTKVSKGIFMSEYKIRTVYNINNRVLGSFVS
jgi:hypothetical protein